MSMRANSGLLIPLLSAAIISLFSGTGHTQSEGEKRKAQFPPAMVVISPVKRGLLAPHGDYTGSVYFSEVSDVSGEVSGIVEKISFDEGQLVKKGHVLLKLNSEILQKRLEALSATYEESQTELEKTKIDFTRIENLFKQESVAEQTYDDYRFKVSSLERRTVSLEKQVERLQVELEKTIIRAPFDGIVLKKLTDRGEWIDPGVKVATIARKNEYDVIVDVPESIAALLETGMKLNVTAGRMELPGKVSAIIPRGDIATRTFPVKIRVNTDAPLMEGMQARVSLPEGKKRESFIVPRDAIVSPFGQTIVFAVVESKAQVVPVSVIGYRGLEAGVESEDLREGMQVVVKGNERLRNGQEVSAGVGKQ
jgi:RND family efflux transporter MFP subunit